MRRLVLDAWRQFIKHQLLTHSAALTYHILFSLVPFLIFLIALLGFLDLSELFDWLRSRTQSFFLDQSASQLNLVLDQLEQRRVGVLSASAFASLFLASSGIRSAMGAMNAVYSVSEARPLLKRYALSLVYTPLVGLLASAAGVLLLTDSKALSVLFQYLGLAGNSARTVAIWLRWPGATVLLVTVVAILYHVCPDNEQRLRFVTPGAGFAVAAWIVMSVGFNFYVRHVSMIGLLYGGVAMVIVIPLYFYISSIILLFGAELNAVAEHYSPEGKDLGQKAPDGAQGHAAKTPAGESPLSQG